MVKDILNPLFEIDEVVDMKEKPTRIQGRRAKTLDCYSKKQRSADRKQSSAKKGLNETREKEKEENETKGKLT
jgi:hypothetical protein